MFIVVLGCFLLGKVLFPLVTLSCLCLLLSSIVFPLVPQRQYITVLDLLLSLVGFPWRCLIMFVCCCPQLLFPFFHVWIYCGLRTISFWFPHHVCSFLASVTSPLVPHMSSMVVLSHFCLGSPSCLFILVLSFSPWFPIVSVHGCPQLCSPWFPTMSAHHHHHFPLGSPSVYRCPQLCSP